MIRVLAPCLMLLVILNGCGKPAAKKKVIANAPPPPPGFRVPIDDAASIPASLRGYVQLALDLGLINARFAVTQGPYDLAPTLHAYFDPTKTVTRAAYAVAAGRYMSHYQSAED